MRNVVVTGGSRGLGLGIARKLASAGYAVVAVARRKTDQLTAAMEAARRGKAGALHFVLILLQDEPHLIVDAVFQLQFFQQRIVDRH